MQHKLRSVTTSIGHTLRSVIIAEGPVAYVRQTGECNEIIVYSTNCVTHKPAGITDDPAKAKRICERLNAYPRQTRQAYGLL